jgi:hypothetical protein
MLREEAEEFLENIGKFHAEDIEPRQKRIEPKNVLDDRLKVLNFVKTYRNVVEQSVKKLCEQKGYSEKPTEKELAKYQKTEFLNSAAWRKPADFKGYAPEFKHTFPETEKKFSGTFKSLREWRSGCEKGGLKEFFEEQRDEDFFGYAQTLFAGRNISGEILNTVFSRLRKLQTREEKLREEEEAEERRVASENAEKQRILQEKADEKYYRKQARKNAVRNGFGKIGELFEGVGEWLESVGEWLDDSYDTISWVGLVLNSIIFVAFTAFAVFCNLGGKSFGGSKTVLFLGCWIPLLMIFIDRQLMRRDTALDCGTQPDDVWDSAYGKFICIFCGIYIVTNLIFSGVFSCSGGCNAFGSCVDSCNKGSCSGLASCGKSFGLWLAQILLPVIGVGIACIPLKVMDGAYIDGAGGTTPTIAAIFVIAFSLMFNVFGFVRAIAVFAVQIVTLIFFDLLFKLSESKLTVEGIGVKIIEWIRSIVLLAIVVGAPFIIYLYF